MRVKGPQNWEDKSSVRSFIKDVQTLREVGQNPTQVSGGGLGLKSRFFLTSFIPFRKNFFVEEKNENSLRRLRLNTARSCNILSFFIQHFACFILCKCKKIYKLQSTIVIEIEIKFIPRSYLLHFLVVKHNFSF